MRNYGELIVIIPTIICVSVYLFVITKELILGKYKDKSSSDILLLYTGGLITVFILGGMILLVIIAAKTSVLLIDLIRSKRTLKDVFKSIPTGGF